MFRRPVVQLVEHRSPKPAVGVRVPPGLPLISSGRAMNIEEESKQFQLDWLKWSVVVLLVGGAIYANWYYGAESALYRALGMIAVVLVAGFIAAKTEKCSYCRAGNGIAH